ncbi:MAG: hypothetical protein AAF283_00775 [Cyanobacteria bacterium P01_A01_bin.70]
MRNQDIKQALTAYPTVHQALNSQRSQPTSHVPLSRCLNESCHHTTDQRQ